MAERAVWRPRWYLWLFLAGGAAWLLHSRTPWLLHGHYLFLVGIALVALLLVLAALWELPPAATMCAAIVLTIFSGSWEAMGLPGFPFLPDRLLLVGALLALWLRSPGAAGLPRVRVRGVHLLLAFTVLYACGSAAAAGTLTTKAGIFDLLDRLGAIPFLMLLVAPVMFAGARERAMLLATLVGLGGYLGLTAVFETLGPHALVFPHYINASDALTPNRQAGGPFQAPITEGFACFGCAVAAAIALARWRGTRRVFAGAVLAVCALGTFLTLERGVWIAAAAGLFAAGVFARELRRLLVPAVLACGLIVGGALLASPTLAGHTSARSADKIPVWDRQNQTAAAMRMIAAKPLLGFGWDSYAKRSSEYFRQSPNYPLTGLSTTKDPLPLHDSYLSYAVELGLLGVLLWLACLGWGLGGAVALGVAPELRAWRVGLVALGSFFAVLAFFNPLQQNFTELLLWTWAGLLVIPPPPAPVPQAAPESGAAREPEPTAGAAPEPAAPPREAVAPALAEGLFAREPVPC
jgi:O-antigen ligase